MKRWAASLIGTEHSRKISVSLYRYPSLAPWPPSNPISSHLPPPCSHLLISLTRYMRAEGEVLSRTTLHLPHWFLNVRPPPLNHHRPPSDASKTPPSLTQPEPYLASRTPRDPHADAPGISAVCVSQTDGQFPLFTISSRRWNVNEP